ncbi:hypothetical protein G9H71_16740, partial [Motilibacter sp. E257]|nr:hypothetical protein [Motilibacter deserti]
MSSPRPGAGSRALSVPRPRTDEHGERDGVVIAPARALLDAVVAIGADLTPGAVLANVVRAAVALVPARLAVLVVLGPDRQAQQLAAAEPGGPAAALLPEDEARAAYARLLAAGPATGVVRVPVTHRGAALGLLLLAPAAPHGPVLGDGDVAAAEALAAAAGGALANARVLEEADRRRRWLE